MSSPTLASATLPIPCVYVCAPSPLREALNPIDHKLLSSLSEPAPDEVYSRKTLVDTPEVLVIAARWRAGGQSELHGHSSSAALYQIVSGRVEDERYVPAGGTLTYELNTLAPGGESYLPAGSFHQVRALEDAITLHAYAPRPDDAVSQLTNDDKRRIDESRRATSSPSHCTNRSHNTSSQLLDVEELARELAPSWGQHEQLALASGSNRVPLRILEDMRASGILAAPLPRPLGGWRASLPETARAVSAIAECAPAAALAVVMPLGNAATCRIPLTAMAPQNGRALRANQRWIAEQVTRGRILAIANSEPGAGANLSQTQTIVTLDANGVSRLTGRKAFATIGPDADYFLCAARTTDTDDPHVKARIDGFFVHCDAPGVKFDDAWDAFGMRTTASVGLSLSDAPTEAILGYPGCLETVNARHWSTLLFSAVFLGIGRAAVREGIRHAGRSPWARAKLAEHWLALEAAGGFLNSVCLAETWPMPRPLLDSVQLVKTFVTQASVQAAVQAATVSGGRCYAAQHPVYRVLADALAGPLLRPPLANAMDILSEQIEGYL